MRAAALAVLAAAPAWGAVTGVEQVHLALGAAPGEVTVSWASPDSQAAPVRWGEEGQPLSHTAAGDTRALNVAGSRSTHVATLAGLSAGQRYTYQVGDAKQFTFTYQRQRPAGEPQRHLIFGDMGASHAFSLCLACTAGSNVCDAATCAGNTTTAGLISEVADADMMLHVGDFAYDFASSGGDTGDAFMRNIEQVAAGVPYMVSHGNHEDSADNLAHYIERFRGMPSNAVPANFTTSAGTTTNTLYFSWDAGLVHYIALSTELWFGVGDSKVDKAAMLAWLEDDLKAANANRGSVPWVVAHGHRDIYCSTGDDADCMAVGPIGAAGKVRADLEPLFFKYGVDFWINGHEHSYERTYPLYKGKSDRSNVDPKATVYIVTGAAGSPEMHEGFTKNQPTWSAFRSNTFGYSRMLVHNATHIHWQQVQTDPTLFPGSEYGRVIDDVWFVQHSHGPFSEAAAPRGTAFAAGDESPGRELDHWRALLGVDDGSGRPTSALVRDWRARHGDDAWARKEDALLKWANARLGAGTVWEDVRGDGSSDGAWFRWRDGRA